MKKRRELFARLVLGFFGTIIIVMGLSSIYSGNFNYSNYWGGVVFAPIAIIIGILVLIVVIFRWKTFDPMFRDDNSNSQKTNMHDNWQKW